MSIEKEVLEGKLKEISVYLNELESIQEERGRDTDLTDQSRLDRVALVTLMMIECLNR